MTVSATRTDKTVVKVKRPLTTVDNPFGRVYLTEIEDFCRRARAAGAQDRQSVYLSEGVISAEIIHNEERT